MAAPVKVKRPRGRPRKVKPETPPLSAYGASPAQTDEMIEDLAGNGRDEAVDETPTEMPPPPVTPFSEALKKRGSGPALTKLFVAAVENGYIIRPAYADSYKGAGDDRSWVVGSREELARMVAWLMAPRGIEPPETDFLGGPRVMPPLTARVEPAEQPQIMPQPTTPHYAPPIGLQADERAG